MERIGWINRIGPRFTVTLANTVRRTIPETRSKRYDRGISPLSETDAATAVARPARYNRRP